MAVAPPTAAAAAMDADDVAFDPSGTGLLSTDAQGAVAETAGLALDASELSAGLAQDVDVLQGASTFATSERTSMASSITALDGRVSSLEQVSPSGSDRVRVLSALASPETVTAQVYVYLPQTQADDAHRIRRHRVIRVQVAPGELESHVTATVAWTFHPDFSAGSDQRPVQPYDPLVWGEIGGKEIYFSSIAPQLPAAVGQPENVIIGVTGPADPFAVQQRWTLTYSPTVAERASGFTLDIYLGMWRVDWVSTTTTLDGFSVDVETAVVVGQ